MNPKKLYIASIVVAMLIFSLSLFNVISYYSSSNQILESATYTDNSNLISVYIENEEGNYVLSETSNFDQGTDYVYNEEKSYCVNESVLSYNTDTSKISVTASGTDNCYVYFDANNITPTLISVKYNGSAYKEERGIFYDFELDSDYDIAYIEVDGILYDIDEEFSCGALYESHEIRVLLSTGVYSNYLTVSTYCTSSPYEVRSVTDANGNEVSIIAVNIQHTANEFIDILNLDLDLGNILLLDLKVAELYLSEEDPDIVEFPFTITLGVSGITSTSIAFILNFNEDVEEWEYVEATPDDGTVTFVVEDLGTIAVAVELW